MTHDDVSPFLAGMARTAEHPEKAFRAGGTTLLSITMGSFNDVGAQYRPAPWAVLKQDQRTKGKKPGPRFSGDPSDLKKSNTLSRAFHLTVSDSHATVSNPTPYAARHQFGYETGGTPPRPFFPVVDGKLTPAAEEKIGAAIKRQLLRDFHAK